MKQLLYFKEECSKGKTKRYYVYSSHSNDKLGVIQWRTGWRCYVMAYDEDIEMSVSCMKELNIFMEELEKERKKKMEKK